VSDASGVWVDPATVPELAEILRRGWLSKVPRIFEGWCENGDRLLQVIKVHGRPLALARCAIPATGSQEPNPAARTAHRGAWNAMWVDLPPEAYYKPQEVPELGETYGYVVVDAPRKPYRLSVECRHQALSIPADWLRGQVAAGVAKRVIDARTRSEIGA
jgi:hypothetical protein